MNYIGDFFAFGIAIVLMMFYFGKKYYLTLPARLYALCLIVNAATITVDIVASTLLTVVGVPLWVDYFLNSLYFFMIIFSTGVFSFYLVSKILLHVYDKVWLKRSFVLILTTVVAYLGVVILNLFNGCLFYFDAAGNYMRGSLNYLGYIVLGIQLCGVFACYIRFFKTANNAMNRVIWQCGIVVALCLSFHAAFDDIMMNEFAMSLVLLVIYLNFQGQRQGVNTITKLNDRLVFYYDISSRIASRQTFQAIAIKIRNIDEINHRNNYKIGDEVLFRFARELEKLIKGSVAFHTSGATFVIVCSLKGDEDGESNIETVQSFIDGGIECVNRNFKLECNIVSYISDATESDVDKTYAKLEYAVYYASSKNLAVHRFSQADVDRMERESYIASRIAHIDREHGYEVWLQPTFCTRKNNFCSAEALLRIREPDGGFISPLEIITAAEENGKIYDITKFVITEVADFLAANPELSALNVSINMPMPLISKQEIADEFMNIIDKRGIDHSRIIFEFTERTIPSDINQVRETMGRMTEKGYRFFLDDFGVGYSNFAGLIKLPFDSIKLDSSICQKVENRRATFRVVSVLTGLFHSMQLSVVAEGIETESQLACLTEIGVDRIQGYYYARPMCMTDTKKFLMEKGY